MSKAKTKTQVKTEPDAEPKAAPRGEKRIPDPAPVPGMLKLYQDTVVPALARSFTLTRTAVAVGRNTSTREPNWMIPMRAP